ncbi:hypothetical protein NDU88_000685 [Pleurodeles waltl]|uniref:Uncharacterized protein n=1 Tax=Pleurodeles waltl TaxID=8319 RepID=A0AAV7P1I5_PLEWA|nr:hypothetical protein NDU88_000685 [Pleurodeles waltl]
MWITKNGQSQDFYDQEDLRLYLDDLTPKSMDTTPQAFPADVPQNSPDAMLQLMPSDVLFPRKQRDPQRAESRRNI